MRGRRAVEPEVAGRGDDPPAEVVLPDPVDHHPRRQRVGRVGDPARQGRADGRASGALGDPSPGRPNPRRSPTAALPAPSCVGSPRTSKWVGPGWLNVPA